MLIKPIIYILTHITSFIVGMALVELHYSILTEPLAIVAMGVLVILLIVWINDMTYNSTIRTVLASISYTAILLLGAILYAGAEYIFIALFSIIAVTSWAVQYGMIYRGIKLTR